MRFYIEMQITVKWKLYINATNLDTLFMIWLITWITNILVTERYNQQSIKFLFFDITTKLTSYCYTITQIKLLNYYWPLCQCLNLNSFKLIILSFPVYLCDPFLWTCILVELKYILVLILKASKYWPMELLIVKWLY